MPQLRGWQINESKIKRTMLSNNNLISQCFPRDAHVAKQPVQPAEEQAASDTIIMLLTDLS